MLEPLSSDKIRQQIHTNDQPEIKIFDIIKSTNTYCLNSKVTFPQIVATERQNAGHGQHGHHFFAPDYRGIYMSVVIAPQLKWLKNPGQLAMALGVLIARAIKIVTGIQVSLKWVNDLYYQNRKCGGIVVEAHDNDQNHVDYLVVGIFVNLYHATFPDWLSQRATTLDQDPKKVSRNQMIAAIYNQIDRLNYNINYLDLMNDYQKDCLWLHKIITVNYDQVNIKGRIMGIDEQARLVVQTADGEIHHLWSTYAEHIRLVKEQ